MKTELFAPVLAWLEAGAPHTPEGIGFNMSNFADEDYPDFEQNPCGTACCIAGAVQQFNKLPPTDLNSVWADINALGKKLGMSLQQILGLFFAADKLERWEWGEYPNTGALLNGQDLYIVTPAMAAKTLRHFMATGEVVWA